MKIYVSPSDQKANVGVGNYGNEADRMQELANYVVGMLQDKFGGVVYGGKNSLSLSERVAESNKVGATIHIALHSNAGGGIGPETWYNPTDTKGQYLAQCLQKRLFTLRGLPTDRGIRDSTGHADTRDTYAAAALTEVGFHDNITDVNWMLSNWREIAQAIVQGVDDFNVVYP